MVMWMLVPLWVRTRGNGKKEIRYLYINCARPVL